MPISIRCPHCGAKLKASSKHVGKQLPCPQCKQGFVVQATESAKALEAKEATVAAVDNEFNLDLSAASADDLMDLGGSDPLDLGALDPAPVPRQKLAIPQGAPAKSAKPLQKPVKKSSTATSATTRSKMPLIIGASAGGVVLLGIVAFVVIQILSPDKPSPAASKPGNSGQTGGSAGKAAEAGSAATVSLDDVRNEFRAVLLDSLLKREPGTSRQDAAMWLAGAGVKPGYSYGATDEYGAHAIEGRMHTSDLHATLLALLGLDHERLTYSYAGRDFRLTDVAGNVVREIFA